MQYFIFVIFNVYYIYTQDSNLFTMEDVLFNGIIAEKAGVKLIESIDHIRTYGWVDLTALKNLNYYKTN